MIPEYAHSIVSHYINKTNKPEKIVFDQTYWRIYVTLYGLGEFRGLTLACQSSSNPDINEAIDEAVKKCFADSRFVYDTDYHVIVTVMQQGTLINPETFILGLHGISTEGACFKETVAVTRCLNMDELLTKLYEKANAKTQLPLWQHESKSYLNNVGELHFAHKLVSNLDDLEERLDVAGEFLAGMGHREGMFYYSYNPVKESYSEENNYIRQLATLWIFCKWVNLRNKREYADFCHRSLQVSYDAYLDNFNLDEVSIAHLAFFLLATLEAQRNKEIDRLQDELVRKITGQQNQDGSFRTILGQEDITKGINYYPCEALLALKTYSEKRRVSIEAIDKAYPFYLFHFKNSPSLSIIPWFTQVYGPEKSSELLDYLVTQQNKDGSFGKEGLASTCTFAEGLAVGGRTEALKKALTFGCQLQFTKENMYYLKNDIALGGIRESLTNCELRIDYTQHFMNAIMLSKGVL